MRTNWKKVAYLFSLLVLLLGGLAPVTRGAASPVVALTISPSSAPNNTDTPVVITGSGFSPATTASLGSLALTVTYVSETQLSALVPWGQAPGVYTLTTSSPSLSLASAFTITLGLGKWINNGPFGGMVLDLVYQAGTGGSPDRLYACVLNAGLFVSSDSGASWSMVVNTTFPMRLQISPADPQVMYLNTSRGFMRTLDGGLSWTTIEPVGGAIGNTLWAFPHPADPAKVLLAAAPNLNEYNNSNYNSLGTGELYLSSNYGSTRSVLADGTLVDRRVTELVFDPQDATHQTLLAGTLAGKLYLSTNGGVSWTEKADLSAGVDANLLPARIDRLGYNPAGHEPWAVRSNPFLTNAWPAFFQGSADLLTWTGQSLEIPLPAGGLRAWALGFGLDKIWAGAGYGYTSPDTGLPSWSALSQLGIPLESWRSFEFTTFAFGPAGSSTVYGGTRDHGVYKSTDGGLNWSAANQGLAGINPYALAVTPGNLNEVYSVSETNGVAKSLDGGQHWVPLNFKRGGYPWVQNSLAVDSFNPNVVYLGNQCNNPSGSPNPTACVTISRNRGATWTDVIMPPPNGSYFSKAEVFAVAANPTYAGVVVAAATFYPTGWMQKVEHPYSMIYYSSNYGLTWLPMYNAMATQFKGAYTLAYDFNGSTLYAGTDGGGVWRSDNGGITWSPLSWGGCLSPYSGYASRAQAVATLQRAGGYGFVTVACEVYNASQQLVSKGLYRSYDYGNNWQQIPMPGTGVKFLQFVQSPQGLALYAGGYGGAARSLNQGASWSAVSGLPAAEVYALAGRADSTRAAVYFSTAAGLGTAATDAARAPKAPLAAAAQSLLPGGAYALLERLYQPSAAQPPVISGVTPASFASGVNTPLTIRGSNMNDVNSVRLGSVQLSSVEVGYDQVTALAPWTLAPGTYNLTLGTAGGLSATLPNAVTVGAAGSGWVSRGPFGGDLSNPSLDPQHPERLFVSANRSGLYLSTDAAATWDYRLITPFAGKVQFSYPTPGQLPLLYVGGDGPAGGIQRSTDYGLSWTNLSPAFVSDGSNAYNSKLAVHPAAPEWVFMSLRARNAPEAKAGLYKSTNRGDSWTQLPGTAGLQVEALALDPTNLNYILIGTDDGKLYISTTGGVSWNGPIAVSSYLGGFEFSPTLYNGLRAIWAVPNDNYSGSPDSDLLYKSLDNGLSWAPLQIQPNSPVYGLSYHPSIPGLAWAAVGNGYYTFNDGLSWIPLNASIGQIHAFAVVPGSGSRQTTTLYAATGTSLYKSSNGGDTWQESAAGLGAALPGAIAISPFNADQAFASVTGRGLMRTFDGGQNWQLTDIPNGHYRAGVAADPFTAGKFYFSYANFQNEADLAVYVTLNHGESYLAQPLALPAEYAGRQAEVVVLAAHPSSEGRLLAGVCLNYTSFPNPSEGLVYASGDGGLSWAAQSMPAGAKCINSLTYDPQNPQQVYAGTEAGLLVSADGGATWAAAAHQPDVHRVGPVVVDPRSSQSIYLFGGPRFNNDSGGDVGTFASHDGGTTWEKLEGQPIYPVWVLQIVPVEGQYWLYAATMNGLRFLRDLPAGSFDRFISWESGSGIAATATVDSFAAAAEGARVVQYIGTSGGLVAAAGDARTDALRRAGLADPASLASTAQNLPGGVYRRQGVESAPVLPTIPGWQRENKPGFQNENNAITALEVFNGQLYAGTANWQSGASLWRSADGLSWSRTSPMGLSDAYGAGNPAVLDLAVFQGKLYATLGYGSNPGQIWRSADGAAWEQVSGTELAAPNRLAFVMAVYNNQLYFATAGGGIGVQVWRSPSGDAGSWVRVAEGGFGDTDNRSSVCLAVFGGKLYVGAHNSVEGTALWSYDGSTWAAANTAGFGDSRNTALNGLAVVGDALYAAVGHSATGGQVWRLQNGSWTQVVADGFGSTANASVNGLFAQGSQLFAVTENQTSGLQVWHSQNGTTWRALNLDGLLNLKNTGVNFSNAFTTFQNRFVLGTWPSSGGGEIWQYIGFPVYVPAVQR